MRACHDWFWFPSSLVNKMARKESISLMTNLDILKFSQNSRPPHEALGNNYRVCGVYSSKPRAEVYCFRLNLNASKLVCYFRHKSENYFMKNNTTTAEVDKDIIYNLFYFIYFMCPLLVEGFHSRLQCI